VVARIERRSNPLQVGFPGLIGPVTSAQVRVKGEVAYGEPLDRCEVTQRRLVAVQQVGYQSAAVRMAVQDECLQTDAPNNATVTSRRHTLSRQLIASGYPFEDEYGYSRAVRVGDQVFVSGTTARPPHLDGNAHAQARAALDLVADALAQAGAGLRHVVRTVVYVVDMADASLVAQAHLEAFGQVRPASTLVQVAALMPAAARVEVEATAVIAD